MEISSKYLPKEYRKAITTLGYKLTTKSSNDADRLNLHTKTLRHGYHDGESKKIIIFKTNDDDFDFATGIHELAHAVARLEGIHDATSYNEEEIIVNKVTYHFFKKNGLLTKKIKAHLLAYHKHYCDKLNKPVKALNSQVKIIMSKIDSLLGPQ